MATIAVERVAEIIAGQVGRLIAYDETYRWAEVRQINDTTGWTYDTPGAQDGWWVRHEGVRLSEDALILAYLRGWRQGMEWSQQQLADRLHVPANTLARWERGELGIRHPEVLGLALERIATAPIQTPVG